MYIITLVQVTWNLYRGIPKPNPDLVPNSGHIPDHFWHSGPDPDQVRNSGPLWSLCMRQNFWMLFWGQIYTRSELQIITQVLIGLRDDSKNDWAVSEDNCFCRAFYPSGRLHWEKRRYFVSYKNPTPIYSAKRLAWLILLWVMSDPLHKAAFWRNENSATSLGERFPKCPNGPQGQFNRIQPSMNKYITY